MENTLDKIRAYDLVMAVAECIRELHEVPSGELYARLMGKMDIETYDRLIRVLVKAGVVEQDPSYLLRWIGPKLKKDVDMGK